MATSSDLATAVVRDASHERQSQEPNLRKSARTTSRKRTYSTFQEIGNKPSSFGYVTNQGKHRCLLCMTELASAELLRKHETMSKLHLANLKDHNVLSRGCTMLAQVYSLPITTSCPQNHEDIEPLMSGALNERSESVSEIHGFHRNMSQTPDIRAGNRLNNNGQQSAHEIVQIEDEAVMEVEPVREQVDGNVEDHESHVDHNLSHTSKRRALRAQTVPTDLSAITSNQLPSDRYKELPETRSTTTSVLPSHIAGVHTTEDLNVFQVLKMLLSRGTESLAKEYIEKHPQLRVEASKNMDKMQQDIGESGLKGS